MTLRRFVLRDGFTAFETGCSTGLLRVERGTVYETESAEEIAAFGYVPHAICEVDDKGRPLEGDDPSFLAGEFRAQAIATLPAGASA